MEVTLPLSALRTIERVLKAEGKVKPSFDEYYVLKALMMLAEEEPVGRQLLSRKLGIGEASARTLIKRLRGEGLITVDAVGGCFLSEKGRELLADVKSVIKRVEFLRTDRLGSMSLDKVACAVVIANGRELLNRGLKISDLRDEVIRFGGSAALVVVVEGGRAILPADAGQVSTEREYPELKALKDELGVREGDLAVVAYASDERTAERALLNFVIKGKASSLLGI